MEATLDENLKTTITEESVENYVTKSIKRAQLFFGEEYFIPGEDDLETQKMLKSVRTRAKYEQFITNELIPKNTYSKSLAVKSAQNLIPKIEPEKAKTFVPKKLPQETLEKVVERFSAGTPEGVAEELRLVAERALISAQELKTSGESVVPFSHGLVPRKAPLLPKPQWHAPWKLMRVISGHTGWVRCLAFEPGNTWFATGSGDRMIKIWDLASGTLKLSLTGHISTVRGLVVSNRHPYLFSCGEDKTIKCWDLEQNKAIRHYHGHLHAVYCITQHPTIDVLVTGSRDSTVRVWDIRTKACAFTLTGHTSTVVALSSQATDPQLVSGSHDSTVRLWDLAAGKSYCTLTNHKKGVRAVVFHSNLNAMASASPDNIKQWVLPNGNLLQTMKGHNAIINALAVNQDEVLVSGGDNGSMYFWDWRTGFNFDSQQTIVQPGSLDSEAGIFALGFDLSGTRLLSCEADKSIKIYKEDDQATEETHPIKFMGGVARATTF